MPRVTDEELQSKEHFLQAVGDERSIAEAVIDDFAVWSRQHGWKPIKPKEQSTYGFRTGSGRVVWSAFPRQEGAKIDFGPREGSAFSESSRQRLRDVVGRLGGETKDVPLIAIALLQDPSARDVLKREVEYCLGIAPAGARKTRRRPKAELQSEHPATVPPSSGNDLPSPAGETPLSTETLAAQRGTPMVLANGYRAEFTGTTFATASALSTLAIRRHGTAVDALRRALLALGWQVSNDTQRDLYAAPRTGMPSLLFEVKTESDLQSIYTAIGQLLLHSIEPGWNPPPRKILVLPSEPDSVIGEKLAALGIEVILYEWRVDGSSQSSDVMLPTLQPLINETTS